MAIISNGKTLTMPLDQFNFMANEREYFRRLYVKSLKRIVDLEDRIKELEAGPKVHSLESVVGKAICKG